MCYISASPASIRNIILFLLAVGASFLTDFESDFQITLITFQLSQDTGMFLLELSKMSFFFFSWRFTSISVGSSWSPECLNFLQLSSVNGSSTHKRLCTNRSLALLQMKCIKWLVWNHANQQVFSSKLRGRRITWTTLTILQLFLWWEWLMRKEVKDGNLHWDTYLCHALINTTERQKL